MINDSFWNLEWDLIDSGHVGISPMDIDDSRNEKTKGQVQISHYVWSLTRKNDTSLIVIKIDISASFVIKTIIMSLWIA